MTMALLLMPYTYICPANAPNLYVMILCVSTVPVNRNEVTVLASKVSQSLQQADNRSKDPLVMVHCPISSVHASRVPQVMTHIRQVILKRVGSYSA